MPTQARRHDDDRADRLGASASTRIGATSSRARRCASMRTCCRPRTAPRRLRSTPSTRSPAAARSYPRQAAIANDHFVFTGKRRRRQADRASAASSRALHGIESRTYATPGRRHLSFLLSRAGPRGARAVHSRRRLAQPRVRRVRRGRHRRRLDHARLRLVDRLHLLHAGEARGASSFSGTAAAVGQRQGHRARAAAPLGREAVAGHVGGVRRSRPRSCRWPIATRSRT